MYQEQPSITIDPGPFRAFVVGWAGRFVTVLAGGDMPAKTAGSDPPVIVRPTPIGFPVTARLEMSVADALAQAPPEALAGPEVPEEHLPWDAEFSEQTYQAVPTDNPVTIVVTIAGNVVDFDLLDEPLSVSRQSGQPLLLRLVDR